MLWHYANVGNLDLILTILGPMVGTLPKNYSENLKTVFSIRTISRWLQRRAYDCDDVIQFLSCLQKIEHHKHLHPGTQTQSNP